MKNDIFDVRRRRRHAGGGGEGEKTRGQIDREVKKHRGRDGEQNQVEKLDSTFFLSSSPSSIFLLVAALCACLAWETA